MKDIPSKIKGKKRTAENVPLVSFSESPRPPKIGFKTKAKAFVKELFSNGQIPYSRMEIFERELSNMNKDYLNFSNEIDEEDFEITENPLYSSTPIIQNLHTTKETSPTMTKMDEDIPDIDKNTSPSADCDCAHNHQRSDISTTSSHPGLSDNKGSEQKEALTDNDVEMITHCQTDIVHDKHADNISTDIELDASDDSIPSFDSKASKIPTPEFPLWSDRDYSTFNYSKNHDGKWNPRFTIGDPVLAIHDYGHPFFTAFIIGFLPKKCYILSFGDRIPTWGIIAEKTLQPYSEQAAEMQKNELDRSLEKLPDEYNPKLFSFAVMVISHDLKHFTRRERITYHQYLHKDLRSSKLFCSHMSKYGYP